MDVEGVSSRSSGATPVVGQGVARGMGRLSRLLLGLVLTVLIPHFGVGSAHADEGWGALGAELEIAPHAAVSLTGFGTTDAQQAGLGYGLQTGATPGCVALPGWQPPALDCTVIAGSSFEQTVTAWAVYTDTGAAAPLRLRAEPLPAGARLLEVTNLGEIAQPVAGEGRVTGRLRFRPTADQATPPGEPLTIDFEVVVGEEGVDPATAPRARIRTRLHVVALVAEERLAVAYAFEDQDGDGAWDEAEPGLPDRRVELVMPDGVRVTAMSDAGGRVGLVGRVLAGPVIGSSVLAIDELPGWRATTPRQVAFRFPSLPWAVPFVRFGQLAAASPGAMMPRLTTGRGCLSAGEDAVYRIGEGLAVRVRVDGVAGAWVRVSLRAPDGTERVLVPGQVIGGEAWYRLDGVAGAPPGARTVRLEAWRGDPSAGPPEATVECDYLVVAGADPAIEIEPRTLELAPVAPGGASTGAVRVRNIGGATLRVDSARPQGGATSPFAVAAADRPPLGLAPGEERELRIVFRPTDEGSFSDFLLVVSNDPNRPLSAVALRGETPGQARSLSASLDTDRGCLETGQDPLYLVDDPIRITYQVDGNVSGRPAVTLELIDAAGTVSLLRRTTVAPGIEQAWSTNARPPSGEATLRLSADSGGLLATAECRVRIVAPTVRLSGYVFRDDNGNGVWDGGPGGPTVPDAEPALSGRRVRLGGPERGEADTDESGAFAFEVSLPGEYRVEPELPSGWRATTTASARVRIYAFPGEQPTALRFGQRPNAVPPVTSATPTAIEPTPVPPPTATPEGSDCLSRGELEDLPLGRRVIPAHSPACYRLWIPTRWGGRLTVRAESGVLTLRRPGGGDPLVDPAARVHLPLGLDEHGWVEVVLSGADLGAGHGIEADFRQSGRAEVLPWNTWRWPMSPESDGPHLFDVPGPMARFDARFGLGDRALAWERRHHRRSEAALWWGHGWGAALAAATLDQPRPAADAEWSQDELEGLAASFFEAVGLPPLAWDWPAMAPRAGEDPTDAFADDLQRVLVRQLRMRGAPIVADLRQESGSDSGEIEVQPHVIYAFESVFSQPGAWPNGESAEASPPDPAIRGARVQVTTVFTANAVFHVGGVSAGDPETTLKRQQSAVSILHYGPWGEIVDGGAAAASGQDWVSLRLRAGLRPPGGALLLPHGIVDPRPAAEAFTGADQPRGENPALDSARLGELGLRVREGIRWP